MNNSNNNAAKTIVKAIYASDTSSMFIVELITGERHWAWAPAVRDIAVGFDLGFNTFSALVSDGFWKARKHTWRKVA